ncbi:hypothetical protein [Metapseudomonas otitidis]|uniref:hypothetical protein n=1 Tax=Metapseudomonas otitidis TaxID=319939 RepID=UPI002448BA68|nr:hypothetical protein [Pseudomonas otitidis]MDG9783950.1 hypothetical protein [Pseudomonas otitidis]
MALRAKLSAPKEEQNQWGWHKANWMELPASSIWNGERRLEAENYLAEGYRLRLAMHKRDCPLFNTVASVWQPSRLKGIQVSREFGTPFLAATQVLDLRPVPRKFLSLDRTDSVEHRMVSSGQIVVTCSGAVGKTALAYAPHENTLISHDLLRVTPLESSNWGWIYAYLKSRQAIAMMGAAQYGHIIKHLEPEHLLALPIPSPSDHHIAAFNEEAHQILNLRNEAWRLQLESEELFRVAIGEVEGTERQFTGFEVKSTELFSGRRRLEGSYHSPAATAILDRFREAELPTIPLSEITNGVWWMTRFKRVFGEEGAPYFSADELFSSNPVATKKVMLEQAENAQDFFVKEGWIVMACSGQTYGLNGSVALMTKWHETAFLSHDLVRVIPNTSLVRPGYLYTALGHPTLGRPLVIRQAYGTSIPHLEPADIAMTPIVRLDHKIESEIADKAERAVALRAEANQLENDLSDRASKLVDVYLGYEHT